MARLEGIYENIYSMKASKMKENLVNDKEQAFLSKTLATIDTKSANREEVCGLFAYLIKINVENLGNSTMRWV